MNWIASTLQPFYQRHRKFVGFTIFVMILCLLNPIINIINGRFFVSDFKVYYFAAKNLLEGGKVYMTAFGEDSGLYKYSPVSLCFFLPLTFFSFNVAALIHLAVLSFSYWAAFLLTRKILATWFFPDTRHEGWLLSLAVICSLVLFVKELYLGNINIILIFLCLLALYYIIIEKDLTAGVLLGIVFLAKPFFLILLVPLLLRRKFKAIFIIALTILTGLVAPLIFLGFQRGLSLTMDWFVILMRHNSVFDSMNSIDYLLKYYFFPGLTHYSQILIIIMVGILASLFVWINVLREKTGNTILGIQQKNLIIEWFLFLAVLPNTIKTDTEHFLVSIPIITFIIYYISVSRRFWLIPLFFILIFFYGGNSQDLLGRDLSLHFFSMGLIGISNLLLILMALFLYLDFMKLKTRNGQRPHN